MALVLLLGGLAAPVLWTHDVAADETSVSNDECLALSHQLRAEVDDAYAQLIHTPMSGPQVPIGSCCEGPGCTTFQSELAASQQFYCALQSEQRQRKQCYAMAAHAPIPDPTGPAFVDISRRLQAAHSPEEVLALAVEWQKTRSAPVQAARLSQADRMRLKLENGVLSKLKTQPKQAMVSQLVKAVADTPWASRTLGAALSVLKVAGKVTQVLSLAKYAAPYSTATDQEEDQYLDSLMQRRIDTAFRRVAGWALYAATRDFVRGVDPGPSISGN